MTFKKYAGSLKLFLEIMKFISLINERYVVPNSGVKAGINYVPHYKFIGKVLTFEPFINKGGRRESSFVFNKPSHH